MDALNKSNAFHETTETLKEQNKMLTQNADVAFISTKSPLVDLFYELKGEFIRENAEKQFAEAWKASPLTTLKIIFNARSIHLGKSEKFSVYNALGWLYEHHPQTLIANLQWLVRPVIEKKPAKPEKDQVKSTKEEDDDDMVMLDEDGEEISDPAAFDVKDGGSHGYWKDLPNIIALASKDMLAWNSSPRALFNVDVRKAKRASKDVWDHDSATKLRVEKRDKTHETAVAKLLADNKYRLLYVTVARLFADQLRLDLNRLKSGDKEQIRKISLAAKWAPSFRGLHDKNTFIVSSIAEILYPHAEVCPDVPTADRETYLKHAREAYRKGTLSPLRKHLDIVERDISAKTYSNIKYDRVPSVAMDRYTELFAKKDNERFATYLEKVVEGTAQISGAILLPGTLVAKARGNAKNSDLKGAVTAKVLDGQWESIVKRIREAGTLQSSIAVCDVSGSMRYPTFLDKTQPMDHAVGLSLLLAEVTAPPFGGSFITFSQSPQVMKAGGPDDKKKFCEKVAYICNSDWGQNTNFVKVFEDLILPIAVENKIPQEDMIKQVFVFSDMQFDGAQMSDARWSTSFERIKKKYEDAGYELPTLVFWNLAESSGFWDSSDSEAEAEQSNDPKPVTADEPGTALVSGYSQGMLKVFLDGGGFEGEDDEIVEEVVKGEDGEDVVTVKKVKPKLDPLKVVKKAVSHKAYSMLRVVD
ncbi:hypothetical protein P152DRAFT_393471 [Eremomyces bilateralis CBS 781.70]|uniref:Uncharacterized protein n=1 Tax=Eremomyces bilateralis CBS 781.70 TaxID=1392243 RepID=A0A6G1G877_9PEZI|nr:uncharacterized protein P152DRAFT_393471 [Eremomyces bilateralis CBS 781.70]KAF1814267.1 hypothetical protein P152DRAFT_393471 [Eremomyces bilateralis CBS 781.70]